MVDLLIEHPSTFHKWYGGEVSASEQARLRGFLHLLDAERGEKKTKLRDVAHGLALIAKDPDLLDEIEQDALLFVQKEINDRTGGALIVLWQERSSGNLSAGIYCDVGMLDAVYVLMLFRIIGQKGIAGNCSVCGNVLERIRGDRRRTCSGKCRKRASRMKAKVPGLRSGIRRRSATA